MPGTGKSPYKGPNTPSLLGNGGLLTVARAGQGHLAWMVMVLPGLMKEFRGFLMQGREPMKSVGSGVTRPPL